MDKILVTEVLFRLLEVISSDDAYILCYTLSRVSIELEAKISSYLQHSSNSKLLGTMLSKAGPIFLINRVCERNYLSLLKYFDMSRVDLNREGLTFIYTDKYRPTRINIYPSHIAAASAGSIDCLEYLLDTQTNSICYNQSLRASIKCLIKKGHYTLLPRLLNVRNFREYYYGDSRVLSDIKDENFCYTAAKYAQPLCFDVLVNMGYSYDIKQCLRAACVISDDMHCHLLNNYLECDYSRGNFEGLTNCNVLKCLKCKILELRNEAAELEYLYE